MFVKMVLNDIEIQMRVTENRWRRFPIVAVYWLLDMKANMNLMV